MAPNLPGDASLPGMNMGFQGFEQYIVRILSVDPNGFATSIATKYNRYMPPISVNNMLGSGALPQPDELWMVNKINGAWTFSSRVQPNLPVVDSVSSLVSTLVTLGFISSDSQIPIAVTEISGAVKIWLTTIAPSGYLLLDGSSYPQATYPALAAILGVSSGDFTLPNFCGRVPTGVLSGDPLFGTLLGTAGQENVSLTLAQLAGHTHPDTGHNHSDIGHNHGSTGNEDAYHSHAPSFAYSNVVYDSGSGYGATSGGPWTLNGFGGTGELTLGNEMEYHAHPTNNAYSGLSTGYASYSAEGSGSPVSVVQPSISVNFIVKT